MNKKIAFSVLLLTIFGMMPAMTTLAANNTWTQTDWTGGTDGGTGATHPTNQTGWNKFSNITGISGTASPGNVVLSNTNLSATDDGTLTTTGLATGGGFVNGTKVNTSVSGSGAGAGITLTGSPVPANFFDTVLSTIPGHNCCTGVIHYGNEDDIYVSTSGFTYYDDGLFKYSISKNTWTDLGGIRDGTIMFRNGGDDDIYFFSNTDESHSHIFNKYSISSNSWTDLAEFPVCCGDFSGSMIQGSDNDIYMSTEVGFYKYSISANSWTTLANADTPGGDMIHYGNENYIYSGGGDNISRYSISNNTWITLAAGPSGAEGAMIRNGGDNDIYVGDGNGLFKYSISSNTWTTLAAGPGFGDEMFRNGGENDIYVSGGTSFFKYSISTNSWTTLTSSPNVINAKMVRKGNDNYIFLLGLNVPFGNPTAIIARYSISGNFWTDSLKATTVVPANVGGGGGMIRNGSDDEVFILQGGNQTGFFKYSITSNAWTTLMAIPGQVSGGSSMIRHGNDNDIYVLSGSQSGFFKYSISSNTWTTLVAPPGTVWVMIRNGSDNDIYAGGGGGLFKYSISNNTWTTLAAAPGNIFGDLIRNGNDNFIYVGGGSGFFKYSISGNSWTTLTSISPCCGVGFAIRNGSDNDIYAITKSDFLEGTDFSKYSISDNTWTTLAMVPVWCCYEGESEYFGDKASMIRNGGDNDIYLLGGPGFFKYSISDNTWTKPAVLPRQVGSTMIRNGADGTIFILGGGDSPYFWRYSIYTNTYPTSGTFTSAVIDMHGASSFGNLSWSKTLPPGTTLNLATRSGATPVPDGTWSAYSAELYNSSGSAITSPTNRYIQYRSKFGTSNTSNTATLNSVTIGYTARAPSGTLVSSAYDSTNPNNGIGGLSWTEDASPPAGTSVTVSLRTATTQSGLTGAWSDFTNTSAGCSKVSGTVSCPTSAIPPAHTSGGNDRFVQYKVAEATTSSTITPIVSEVIVTLNSQGAAAPNLILNPSLETAGTGGTPTNWFKGGFGSNNRVLTYPVVGQDGAKAARINITTYASGNAKWYFTNVPVTPGKTYVFSDYYKSNVPTSVGSQFKMANGTFTYDLATQSAASPSGWSQVQRTFTVPANVVSLTVFHSIGQIGYLTTDNFSLTVVPDNLILNPSLETAGTGGTPANWFKGGFGTNNRVLTYPVAGQDGAKAARIDITTYASGNAKWYFTNVPVTPGKTYVFSDYYKSNVPTSVGSQFKMANGTFTYDLATQSAASPSGWSQVQRTFTVPANVVSLTVFHSIGQIGYLITDNFSLTLLNP